MLESEKYGEKHWKNLQMLNFHPQLRQLFVFIITTNDCIDASHLWNKYKKKLSEDFFNNLVMKDDFSMSTERIHEIAEEKGLYELEKC